MAQEYYNLVKAAEVLGTTPAEVNLMREQGRLTGYRDGSDWKFKKNDVDSALADKIRNKSNDDDDLLLNDVEYGETDGETDATMLGDLGSLADLAGLGEGGDAEASDDDDLVLGDGLELAVDEQPTKLGGDDEDDIFKLAGDDDQVKVDVAGLDDDDVVLGGSGSGSDLNLGGDSGISLTDDAVLELDNPVEILGGADDELELGEDEMLSLTEADVDSDTATQLQPDEDFLLSADDGDDLLGGDDSDSSSQVIALDSDADFGDLLDGVDDGPSIEVDDEPVVELDLDGPVDSGGLDFEPAGDAAPSGGIDVSAGFDAATTPASAAMGAPMAAAAPIPEAPYSGLLIAGLGMCLLMLCICGFVTVDLVRNMWSWDQPFALNSSLMDTILGMLGG